MKDGRVGARRPMWIPRSLAVLFAAFLSLFAFDAAPSGFAPMELAGFLIHLAPAFTVVGALIAAWNRPRLAGALNIGLAAAFTVLFKAYRSIPALMAIGFPLFLAGLLFMAFSSLG